MVCPLYRGCPLLRGSNHIILIGRDKFGDLVLSFVERYLIQCPFLGGSSLRGSTVYTVPSIDADMLVSVINDVFLRLNLSLTEYVVSATMVQLL